jgi:anti-sigma factor RsiW
MTHEEIRAELSEYRDGELSPARREALARHVSDCASCRGELRDWEVLAKAFLRRPPEPTRAQTERCVSGVLSRLPPPRATLWELLSGGPWLTPALGLASAALVLSFLPYGSRPSVPSASEPVFVAEGQEIALASAAPGRAEGVEEAVGLADEGR